MAFNCVDCACEPEVYAVSPVRHRGLLAALRGRSPASPHFAAHAGWASSL